jgi:hypothetical protein
MDREQIILQLTVVSCAFVVVLNKQLRHSFKLWRTQDKGLSRDSECTMLPQLFINVNEMNKQHKLYTLYSYETQWQLQSGTHTLQNVLHSTLH